VLFACDVTCVWCYSAYDDVSRRQVFILEAVGLFSGSIGVWLHHVPYIPFTAGLVAAIASQSPYVMQVSITQSLMSPSPGPTRSV